MTDIHATLTALAKRRGLYFPSTDVYESVAGLYTYGPQGTALKQNLEASWRDRFVRREGHMEIESPTVMPESVFEASGHLDSFADMLVECAACGESTRADHVVEDATDIEEAESYSSEEIGALITDHDITCPTCGERLAGQAVTDFNLMFGTNIGPGSSSPGYLRPETAQGIFVEFPQLAGYARNQLPFAVAQTGKAYRNEISPRQALVRVREFTQAELEHFIDPEEDEPPIRDVADVVLPLYPVEEQQHDDGTLRELSVRKAIDTGVIGSTWIAYYLGVSKGWYDRIGIDMNRFRYRQHLPEERAHYAADCWDAEAKIDDEWIEITGFAYRGDYDLQKHANHTSKDYSIFRQFDTPRTVEQPRVDPDMSYLGPKYGNAASDIADALSDLAARTPDAFKAESVTVTVNGQAYMIPREKTGFAFEEVTDSGEQVRPHVVEPSFGIDRIVYSVLAHSYQEDVIDDDQRTRLELPVELAPTFVAVLPLMDRDGLDTYAQDVADELRAEGFSVAYDDSGSIGRRYRRQDEVGTPFCVTVDHDTLEDETVTLRDRDSTAQRRVAVGELNDVLTALHADERTFDETGTKVIT